VMCVALAEIDIANDAESGRLASQLYGDILYNPRSRVVQMIMESMADDE
jgi:hypothetical protein